MNKALALTAAVAMAASTMVVPSFAAAQSRYDNCREQQRRSANTGTIVGGVAGALLGSGVASRGVKTEGALLGGAVGAVAGHQVGKNNAKCNPAPRRAAVRERDYQRSSYQRNNYAQPNNCRWVNEYYGGRNHSFEVCRGRDGAWRPSGRS